MSVFVAGARFVCGHWKKPRFSVGSATTVWPMARSASTRPVPASYAPAPATGTVLPTIAALSRSPSQSGCSCLRIAARPATCGVAIEVPLNDV